VAVEREARNDLVVALDADVVRASEVERDGIVNQLGDVDFFGDTAPACMGLLRRYDLADVLDMCGDRLHLGVQGTVFHGKFLAEL